MLICVSCLHSAAVLMLMLN